MAAAKPQPSPPAADEADFAVFRLLLPPSFTDADTMSLYAAVNPLRRRTAALQVRVEPLDASHPSTSSSRVAAVLGPTTPVRRVEASSSSGEPLALSPVQEALVAVIDADGALHPADEGARGCVKCLLLVEAARLEAALGRGALGRIAMDAGASVRVAPWDEEAPSPRGQPPEEVVEITGDRTAIRKAIVALSSCLQGDLPVSDSTTYGKKEGSELSRASSEVPEPNTGTLCSEPSTQYVQSSVPKIDRPQTVTRDVQAKCLQQVSFRLLCPVNIAGGLIGKKGLIIKGIEDETGACIDVGAPLSGCMERLITISALESQDSDNIVQSALLCIFDRMAELESYKSSSFDMLPHYTARALVLKSQFGCLVGLGGSIIREMVNATGARIQILDDTDIPACASQFELVLQITGELTNVRDALCLVSSKLRNHVFSFKSSNNNNGYVPSSDIAESNTTSQVNISTTSQYSTESFQRVDQGTSLSYDMDSVEKSLSAFQLGSSEVQKSDNGNGGINNSDNGITFPEENNHVRGVEPARITRITFETAVSESILYLVYGDNGNNLAQLTEISGADISVYNPPSEGNEAIIVISGPPDNAHSAQRLLIELILQEQS